VARSALTTEKDPGGPSGTRPAGLRVTRQEDVISIRALVVYEWTQTPAVRGCGTARARRWGMTLGAVSKTYLPAPA